MQGKALKLDEINTKITYWHLVNTFSQRPTSEAKWNKKIGVIIDEDMWNIIYTNYQKLVKDTTILNFQFKITHRILACTNLEIWSIRQNSRCDYCKETDTIEHMLIYCKETYIHFGNKFLTGGQIT